MEFKKEESDTGEERETSEWNYTTTINGVRSDYVFDDEAFLIVVGPDYYRMIKDGPWEEPKLDNWGEEFWE